MEFLYRKFIKNFNNTRDPNVIKKYGVFAGVVGIIFNVILFLIKIVLALISGSVSIISDAFNNLSDASSSLITTIGFKISSRPADKDHPFGYQRVEYICAFIISCIIIFIGIELGISSIKKIFNPGKIVFNYIMLLILFLTILFKGFLGVFYSKTGKKINSLSLKASSRDSFNDVVTTSLIVVGLIVGKIFGVNIDGYLGMAICLYIIVGGVNLIKETIDKLIGGSPDIELIEKIKNEVLKENNILGVHDILFHYYGYRQVYMSLHAEVDSSLSLIVAHDLVDGIEKKIKKMYEVDLVVHIDPVLLNDQLLIKINDELNIIIKNINQILSFHELKIINKKGKKIICFDLSIPYDFELSNGELYKEINSKLKEIDEKYRASINFDKI